MYARSKLTTTLKNVLNFVQLQSKLSQTTDTQLVSSIPSKISSSLPTQLQSANKRHFCALPKSKRTVYKRLVLEGSALKQESQRHLRLRARSATQLPEVFKMEWPKITLFGDSITRRSMDPDNGCWASFIAHHVGAFMNVDPRGFDGYNSRWGLSLMPKLFPKSYLEKVEIFIPFFGHNDAWAKPFPAHVPVEEYESNMRGIIKYLNENGLGNEKIILITPTWFHNESFQVFLKESHFPSLTKDLETAKKYSDAILRIAKDLNITVLDFFEISLKQEPLKEMFCDGIHYSRKGARLLYQHLIPIIEEKVGTTFKKPFADLWHVIPLEERDEVKPLLMAYRETLKKG